MYSPSFSRLGRLELQEERLDPLRVRLSLIIIIYRNNNNIIIIIWWILLIMTIAFRYEVASGRGKHNYTNTHSNHNNTKCSNTNNSSEMLSWYVCVETTYCILYMLYIYIVLLSLRIYCIMYAFLVPACIGY